MHLNRKITAFITAAAILAIPITSQAETRTKISSISLKIISEIEAGDSGSEVTVTTSSSKYSVEDTEVTNEPDDEWEDGDKSKSKGYVRSRRGLLLCFRIFKKQR